MTEIENMMEILKQIHSREQEKKDLYNHHYYLISVLYDSCKVNTSVTPLLHTTSISPVRKYKFIDSGCGEDGGGDE